MSTWIICIFVYCLCVCLRVSMEYKKNIFSQVNDGLIPYDTAHKGTSKYHKPDEKSTHFVVHVPPSIFLI